MKITDVVVRGCSAPLRMPFTSHAVKTTSRLETVLVELVTDDGLSGWGESAPIRSLGDETTATAEAALTGPLGAAVRGRRLDDLDDLAALGDAINHAVPDSPSAKAALDIAAHDLVARRAGEPLHAVFGGPVRDLTTAVTIALGAPAEMARQAQAWAADGFPILKVKVGGRPDEDLRRVCAVRDAAGPAIRLWLDGNQGWDADTAVRVLREIEDAGLDVELVEQPVRADDLAGLAFTRKHVATPVVADESVLSTEDILEIIRREAADVLNVKLQKNGGIRGTLRLVSLAERAGLTCMVGCTLESAVSITAAACAIATHPAVPYVDLDAPLWLAEPLVSGGVTFAGPRIRLPDRPGLGVRSQAHTRD